MNKKVWKPETQAAIEQYYYCHTAVTSAQTRHFLFNYILYHPINNLCQTALKSFKNPKLITDENQQELLVFAYNLLNKLDPSRFKDGLIATQNFLYVGLRRNVINIIRKERQTRNEIVSEINDGEIDTLSNYYLVDENLCADRKINEEEIRVEIIRQLDRKIQKERVVNKSSTIFLILLKTYLLDNDFDERGFKQYVMTKMNIDISMYRAIASKVKISTIPLNKEY